MRSLRAARHPALTQDPPMPMTKLSRAVILCIAMTVAAPMHAQSLKPDEVVSSLALIPLEKPNPVLGADNRIHLAYELLAVNPTKLFLTIDQVDVVDSAGAVLSTMTGDRLGEMLVATGGGRRLAPGASAYVFLDVSFPAGTRLPKTLSSRVTLTRERADAAGKPAGYPSTEPLPATITFTGAPVAIATTPAIVIGAPLRGANWVALNGCCDAVTSHRGAVMAINGRLRVPERFAIDWMQLDGQDRLYTGPAGTLTSYVSFGHKVYSVADGIVVNRYDDTFEQVPGAPARDITPANIGGNMLVVDIGGGHYAFYAHLQPGSLKFRIGDKVKAGDVLALLGNTGNSDAPHLHFHVMDGPSPLDANGLPYVFRQFEGTGMLDINSADAMFTNGAPGVIDRKKLAGRHRNQMPLNLQVVDFGP